MKRAPDAVSHLAPSEVKAADQTGLFRRRSSRRPCRNRNGTDRLQRPFVPASKSAICANLTARRGCKGRFRLFFKNTGKLHQAFDVMTIPCVGIVLDVACIRSPSPPRPMERDGRDLRSPAPPSGTRRSVLPALRFSAGERLRVAVVCDFNPGSGKAHLYIKVLTPSQAPQGLDRRLLRERGRADCCKRGRRPDHHK